MVVTVVVLVMVVTVVVMVAAVVQVVATAARPPVSAHSGQPFPGPSLTREMAGLGVSCPHAQPGIPPVVSSALLWQIREAARRAYSIQPLTTDFSCGDSLHAKMSMSASDIDAENRIVAQTDPTREPPPASNLRAP